MTVVKHTPGPWLADDRNGSVTDVSCTDGVQRGRFAVNVFQAEHGPMPMIRVGGLASDANETVVANARLTAASPDLISVAKRWVALDGEEWHPTRYANDKTSLLDDTRAAIAKAEGRS